MNCPPEVAEILLAILQTGLLRILRSGWANESRRCAIEADHLHNLPARLTQHSAELLRFYWDVERTEFLRQSEGDDVSAFERHWARLAALAEGERVASLAS